MVGVPGQEAHRVDTPDGRLAVEILGPRTGHTTVVCLHGLSANRTTWRPVAERLAHRHRFLLIDLLGRGESDVSLRARYDLESEVLRLLRALEASGVDRPLLAGHSHGAAIAVAACRRARARGLLLVNPVTPDLPRPPILAALRYPAVRAIVSPAARVFRRPLTRYMLVRRVFADRDAIPAGLVASYARPWGDRDRAAGLLRILADWDPAELEKWDGPAEVPVGVVAGERDRRIDPDAVRRWTDRLGGSLELAEGCGHSAPEESTLQVATALETLLDTVEDQSARQEERRDDQERPVDSTSGA